MNALKNHEKVTSLYLCPIVWSCDCGCVTPLSLKKKKKNAPVMLWLASDTPTPTPRSLGEQQCHEWMTYPHKNPYLKIHIFIAQEKMHWIRIQFCPTDVHSSEKISFHFPYSTHLNLEAFINNSHHIYSLSHKLLLCQYI